MRVRVKIQYPVTRSWIGFPLWSQQYVLGISWDIQFWFKKSGELKEIWVRAAVRIDDSPNISKSRIMRWRGEPKAIVTEVTISNFGVWNWVCPWDVSWLFDGMVCGIRFTTSRWVGDRILHRKFIERYLRMLRGKSIFGRKNTHSIKCLKWTLKFENPASRFKAGLQMVVEVATPTRSIFVKPSKAKKKPANKLCGSSAVRFHFGSTMGFHFGATVEPSFGPRCSWTTVLPKWKWKMWYQNGSPWCLTGLHPWKNPIDVGWIALYTSSPFHPFAIQSGVATWCHLKSYILQDTKWLDYIISAPSSI